MGIVMQFYLSFGWSQMYAVYIMLTVSYDLPFAVEDDIFCFVFSVEHEVLEREIGRLRALYKQQHQPEAEKPLFSHRQTTSMESQFANISLKNKESVAVRDGPLHI